MSRAGPSIAEERALALAARKLPVAGVPWRANGVLWSLAFFGLTALALAATFWLLHAFRLPHGWITGAVALVLAEVLIRRHHFFGTGVESALWLGWLFAVIFGLRGSGQPEALLLFAAACAIAGFRMRNALFGGAAAALMVAYLAARDLHALAAAVGVAVSLAALLAITREVQRPSTDWLLCALLLITPVTGAVATAGTLSAAWAIAYLAAAIAGGAVGIGARLHAPLVAMAVHVGIGIGTLVAHDLPPWPAHWQMIAGGVLVLALSAALSRALRARTRGVVLVPSTLTRFDEAVEIAGSLAMQVRASAPPPAPAARESGGRFGGGGATGEF